jgi:uncharacterized membrane protein
MAFLIMHIIHLLAVIVWIGGLAFVTIIIFPVIFKTPDPLQKVLTFQRIERRFAKIARWFVVIVGLSGFAMLYLTGWHALLFTTPGLPLTFMTVVWIFWMIMLFGVEPLVIKKMLERMAKEGNEMTIDSVFARVNRMHWLLLFISLLASIAGVLTAHMGSGF